MADPVIRIKGSDESKAAFASVARNLEKLTSQARTVGNSLRGMFAGIGIHEVSEFAKSLVDSAAAMDDLAEVTGGGVAGLSKLVDVARIGGGDLKTVESAVLALNRALLNPQAEENKGVGAALAAINLSSRELLELTPEKRIEEVAKALAGFADSGDKALVIQTIFKKQAAEIAPFLKDVSENLDRAASLTAKQAAEAEKAQKAMAALGVEFSNIARIIAVEYAGSLARALESTVAFIRGAGGIDAAFAALAGGGLRKNLPQLRTDLSELQTLLGKQEASFVGRNLPSVGVDITKRQIANVEAAIRSEEALRAVQRKQALALGEGLGPDREARGVARSGSTGLAQVEFKGGTPPKIPKVGGGGGSRAASISEGERLIQQLTMEVAKKDDLSRVEEILAQAKAKSIKFDSEAQRQQALTLAGTIDAIRMRKEESAAIQAHFQPLEEEAQALQLEMDTLGKTRAEIELTTTARIDEAIVIARANGASEEHIAFLERERDLRRDIAKSAGQQEVEQFRSLGADVKLEEQRAKLQRMAESVGKEGGLTGEQFSQSAAAFLNLEGQAEKSFDAMTEFAKEGARNIQDALADGLFNLMQGKFDNLLDQLKQTLDRMAANILAAQLGEKLFGDLAKTGKPGGWVGDLIGLIGGGGGGVGSAASAGFAALSDLGLESFAVGTSFVPRDMIAKIHKGEEIIPAGKNGRSRAVVINIHGVSNPNEWRASQGQIASDMQRALGGGRRFV